jgi:hypothetical protein
VCWGGTSRNPFVYLYCFCLLARGWTVRGSKPDEGKIFCTRLDRPRSPSGLLYNGYRISFQVVQWPGRGVDHPAQPSADVKERVQQCLYFPPWAFMACYKKNLGFLFTLSFICVFTFCIYSYLLSFFLYFFLYFFFINLIIFLLLVYTYKVQIGN